MLEDAKGYNGYTGELTDDMVKLLETKGYALRSGGTMRYQNFVVYNSDYGMKEFYGKIFGAHDLSMDCKVITSTDLTSKKLQTLKALRGFR